VVRGRHGSRQRFPFQDEQNLGKWFGRVMAASSALGTDLTDLSAVFAASKSLWGACQRAAAENENLNLSHSYAGMDGLMRQVMLIAIRFDTWATKHVAFDETTEVWPYLLDEQFGDACVAVVYCEELMKFDETDCLRVALRLNLPIRLDTGLPVPVDARAVNPIAGSEFIAFRIRTVRWSRESESLEPFTVCDEPFDTDCEPAIFGLYGVSPTGEMEHVADRTSYAEAVSLVHKIAPGICFPSTPTNH
jgi:hypothetical protein